MFALGEGELRPYRILVKGFELSLKEWLGKNHYVTKPEDPDAFFRPRRYSQPRDAVMSAAREIIAALGGWRLEEIRENQGLLRCTRSAIFPPNAQDINVYIVTGSDGITSLEMTSISRGAKRDWGRNKKNLREFLARMDNKLAPL